MTNTANNNNTSANNTYALRLLRTVLQIST